MAGRDRGDRVAGGEALGGSRVGRVPVVDAESRQRREERLLRVAQRHAVLGAPRPGEARLDRGEVELDDLGVRGLAVGRVVPEEVLLAVRLDEGDLLLVAPRQPQVRERLLVDREEAARRAVLG